METRAFRLGWPAGVRLFELDLPELFQFKESVLAEQGAAARCQRFTIAVDLRADWATALTGAGFDSSGPTAWLAEGLMPYLTTADNDRLLTMISRLSVPGSRVAVDHMDSSARPRRHARDLGGGAYYGRVLEVHYGRSGWLASRTWMAGPVARVPELGVSYCRSLPDFIDLTASNATMLCTATR